MYSIHDFIANTEKNSKEPCLPKLVGCWKVGLKLSFNTVCKVSTEFSSHK